MKSTLKFEWNHHDEINLNKVNEAEKLSFIKQNSPQKTFSISKPIFFRNKSHCVISTSNIYYLSNSIRGSSSLFILKKMNNKWSLNRKSIFKITSGIF